MLTFRAVDVETAEARTALSRYFADRQVKMPWLPEPSHFPPNAEFTAPNGLFLIGLADGAIVACGGIRRLSDVRFEVKDVWVDSTLRGRGLGRSLMAELERHGIGMGAVEFVLDTHEVLTAAIAMYESLRYVQIPRYNDNPHPTHWYGKRLEN